MRPCARACRAASRRSRTAWSTTKWRGPRTANASSSSTALPGRCAVWDHTFDALARAGYRVLRYDLFGRGFSDRPDATYDLALFRRQLDDLVAHVGWQGRSFSVVGSSMGSIIAADLATRRANDIERVVLIGPAGFAIEANPAAKLLPIPGVGDYTMTVIGDRMLKKHNRKYYYAPERFPKPTRSSPSSSSYKGYKRAILSTMRKMPMNDFADGYRALGASNKPVLLLWGRQDTTFPYSNMPAAQALVPQAHAITIEEAGHVPQYEQHECRRRGDPRVLARAGAARPRGPRGQRRARACEQQRRRRRASSTAATGPTDASRTRSIPKRCRRSRGPRPVGRHDRSVPRLRA